MRSMMTAYSDGSPWITLSMWTRSATTPGSFIAFTRSTRASGNVRSVPVIYKKKPSHIRMRRFWTTLLPLIYYHYLFYPSWVSYRRTLYASWDASYHRIFYASLDVCPPSTIVDYPSLFSFDLLSGRPLPHALRWSC